MIKCSYVLIFFVLLLFSCFEEAKNNEVIEKIVDVKSSCSMLHYRNDILIDSLSIFWSNSQLERFSGYKQVNGNWVKTNVYLYSQVNSLTNYDSNLYFKDDLGLISFIDNNVSNETINTLIKYCKDSISSFNELNLTFENINSGILSEYHNKYKSVNLDKALFQFSNSDLKKVFFYFSDNSFVEQTYTYLDNNISKINISYKNEGLHYSGVDTYEFEWR